MEQSVGLFLFLPLVSVILMPWAAKLNRRLADFLAHGVPWLRIRSRR